MEFSACQWCCFVHKMLDRLTSKNPFVFSYSTVFFSVCIGTEDIHVITSIKAEVALGVVIFQVCLSPQPNSHRHLKFIYILYKYSRDIILQILKDVKNILTQIYHIHNRLLQLREKKSYI